MAVEPARAHPVPRNGAFDAIDFAIEELGIASFADLDMGQSYGEHAFYAIEKPTVSEGVLADARPTRARDQLLTAIERAGEHAGMRVVDGDIVDPATIHEIGQVDAILMFNLLLHMVAPDWGRVIELYAPFTSCFVMTNPQWAEHEHSIRLVELGRERFLEAVTPSAAHLSLFDRLDEWYPTQNRTHRDSRSVWQWGITDIDLEAKMADLGFGLDYRRSLGPFPGASGFERKAFVFSRVSQRRVEAGYEAAAADLQARLAAAERERDELGARLERLERDHADLLNSQSWRLTEPLRRLKRRIGRRG
jgi:hypothetical protein